MTFAPTLIPRLPIFPPGAWNVGHISADPSSGLPQFSKIVCEHLPGVTTTWHSTFIDYLDLDFDDTERLRSNVRHAMCKRLPGVALVVKFAQFDWEISYMEGETETYQWLQDHDIGPKFMGHLTEEGRVIAFLIESIQDTRRAGTEDLELCQTALQRLHDLSILHGDLNRHNILIHENCATLIDFENAAKTADDALLEQEWQACPKDCKMTPTKAAWVRPKTLKMAARQNIPQCLQHQTTSYDDRVRLRCFVRSPGRLTSYHAATVVRY